MLDLVTLQLSYDPFKEDVYSCGLLILQMMLMCNQKDLEEISKDSELLKAIIVQKFVSLPELSSSSPTKASSKKTPLKRYNTALSRKTLDNAYYSGGGQKSPLKPKASQQFERYSQNLICLILTMLQKDNRPDFREMQYLFKDIMRMGNCDHYLSALLAETPDRTKLIQMPLHKQLFKNVDQFVSYKLGQPDIDEEYPVVLMTETEELNESFLGSLSSSRGPQRFLPSQIRLTCPVHDNMPFKFFDTQSQNYMCNICVLDQNTGISHNWIDLQKKAAETSKCFEIQRTRIENLKKQVVSMKSGLKSGKHIDKFFD